MLSFLVNALSQDGRIDLLLTLGRALFQSVESVNVEIGSRLNLLAANFEAAFLNRRDEGVRVGYSTLHLGNPKNPSGFQTPPRLLHKAWPINT